MSFLKHKQNVPFKGNIYAIDMIIWILFVSKLEIIFYVVWFIMMMYVIAGVVPGNDNILWLPVLSSGITILTGLLLYAKLIQMTSIVIDIYHQILNDNELEVANKPIIPWINENYALKYKSTDVLYDDFNYMTFVYQIKYKLIKIWNKYNFIIQTSYLIINCIIIISTTSNDIDEAKKYIKNNCPNFYTSSGCDYDNNIHCDTCQNKDNLSSATSFVQIFAFIPLIIAVHKLVFIACKKLQINCCIRISDTHNRISIITKLILFFAKQSIIIYSNDKTTKIVFFILSCLSLIFIALITGNRHFKVLYDLPIANPKLFTFTYLFSYISSILLTMLISIHSFSSGTKGFQLRLSFWGGIFPLEVFLCVVFTKLYNNEIAIFIQQLKEDSNRDVKVNKYFDIALPKEKSLPSSMSLLYYAQLLNVFITSFNVILMIHTICHMKFWHDDLQLYSQNFYWDTVYFYVDWFVYFSTGYATAMMINGILCLISMKKNVSNVKNFGLRQKLLDFKSQQL